MNPYAILGGIALLIAVALGGAQTGRKLERSAWQAKEIAAQDRYVRSQKFNEAISRKASTDHAQAISALTAQYATARAAIRTDGGLRVSMSICDDPRDAATEGASASRVDATSAGTVALPEIVESRLLALAQEADELAERLRALQGWVKSNGQYGDVQEKGNP